MARLRCFGAVLCAALAIPHLASAQAFRVGENANFGGTPQILYPDVAYDPVNKRYFEVTTASSHTVIEGRFVTPTAPASNSYQLSGTVTISTPSFLNEYPRVTYSPHVGGGGGFLVTWHKGFSSGAAMFAKVMGRLYSASGAPLTDEFVVSTSTSATGSNSSQYGMGAPSAYASGSREFLVVWASSKYEVIGQRVSTTGAANGSNFLISQGGVGRYDRDPSVAYSPAVDKFYVGWGVFIDASLSGRAEGRLVQASTGALGSILALDNAKGVSITSVAYNATADQFLFSWYHDDGVGSQYTYGSILSSSGAVVGPSVRVLSALYSAYNALDVEFNQLAGEYLLVTHGNDSLSNGKEDFGVSIRSDGTPHSNGFRVTVTNAAGGNYNPRVATSTDRKEWLVVTSTNFLQVSGQFVGSNGTGSSTPPETSCTMSFSTSGQAYGAAGGNGAFTLTTESSCPWNAASNVSWLALSSGSGSGTGSKTLSYVVAPNTSKDSRTGIIYSGNRSVTVTQAGASKKDFNRDGLNDLLWQNRSTGELAVWRMNGINIISGNALSPGNVGDNNWKIMGAFDSNRDGQLDLLFQHDTGYVAIWLMSGETRLSGFVLNHSVLADPQWRIVGTGDMDRDGFSDIVWQHADGRVAVWYMGGDGSQVREGEVIATVRDAGWRVVGIDDFDSDNKLDLVWHHSGDGQVVIWYMNDRQYLGYATVNMSVPTEWQIVAVGDYGGDGKPDFIWRNSVTGGLAAWFMSNATFTSGWFLSPGRVADTNWHIVGPR